MRFALPKSAVKKIGAAVDLVFDRVLAKFLERPPGDKRIVIGRRPRATLPSIFRTASEEERAPVNEHALNTLMQVAEGFVEAQRSRTKAHVVKAVASWLDEAHAGGVETDLETVLGGELALVFGKAHEDVKRILDTEATVARNTGTLEGIVRVNAASGIGDPTVYFIVVHDGDLCEECLRLHLLDDEVTPRVWRLSELKRGYHKKGEDRPALGGEHPHCRCALATLMPGYGFKGGSLEWVGVDHDELAAQRGLEKSEDSWLELLVKSTREGLERVFPALAKKVQDNESKFTKGEADPYEEEHLLHAVPTVTFPSEVAPRIVKAGRWKNLYETGDGRGSTNPDVRRDWETDLGIPEDALHNERPIYGALSWRPVHRYRGNAPQYGDAWAVLKPHKAAHVTYTPADSSRLDEISTPFFHPLYLHKHLPEVVAHHSRTRRSAYVEAQVHGGIYPAEDVDSLHLGPGDYEEERLGSLLPMARKFGIPLYKNSSYGSDTALVYDPRSDTERAEHTALRGRLMKDVSDVADRARRDADDPRSDTERAEKLRRLAYQGEAALAHLDAPYNRHTVRGHEFFVPRAREMYGQDLFPYPTDVTSENRPAGAQLQLQFPGEKPPAPAAPAAGSRTSRKPRSRTKAPSPGSRPGSASR